MLDESANHYISGQIPELPLEILCLDHIQHHSYSMDSTYNQLGNCFYLGMVFHCKPFLHFLCMNGNHTGSDLQDVFFEFLDRMRDYKHSIQSTNNSCDMIFVSSIAYFFPYILCRQSGQVVQCV